MLSVFSETWTPSDVHCIRPVDKVTALIGCAVARAVAFANVAPDYGVRFWLASV